MPSLVQPTIPPGALAASAQPVLAAGSCALRPWASEDAPALLAAYAEPDIQRWHARSLSPAEAEEWIAEATAAWSTETAASWAVTAGGQLAGRMTLKFHLPDGCADAAYWIREAYRSRGLASDALDAATQWAFSAAKAGFTAEGTRRGGALHADGWHDMHTHGKIAWDVKETRSPARRRTSSEPTPASGASPVRSPHAD